MYIYKIYYVCVKNIHCHCSEIVKSRKETKWQQYFKRKPRQFISYAHEADQLLALRKRKENKKMKYFHINPVCNQFPSKLIFMFDV